MNSHLKVAKELIYDKCDFDLLNLQINPESKEYAACSFELNGKKIEYRVSKITPTKAGQFVSIWKRNKNGITEPFHITDELDYIIISVSSGEQFGQFIFPKNILAEKGIITQNGREGKRGIRIYAPWDNALNKQAQQTQSWQTEYFMTISKDKLSDLGVVKNFLKNVGLSN